MLAASVHHELQTVSLPLQVRQLEDFRFIIGAVHVVDAELLEVADHNPAGILIVGQIPGIPPGLLEGGQHGPVRLLVTLCQINIPSLLLD